MDKSLKMAKRIQPPESRAMNHSPNTDGHGAEDARLRLRALRVTRMEAGCCHRPMRLELEAEGLPEAVAAMQDFANALKQVRPSAGPWFSSARNIVEYGNRDGQYDDLAAYMKANKLL